MKKLLLLSALGLCSLPLLASAQTTKKADEPETLILSDSLSYDDTNKTSNFKGNVILTRGLMRLTADEVNLKEDAKGFQHATATVKGAKKVTIYEERPENYETIHAEGLTATYNGETEVVRLVGQSIVTRSVCGKVVDVLRGDIVTYNSKNSTYSATGGPNAPDRGRVRSLVQARSKVDAAVAECRTRYNGKPMPSNLKKSS
ncbi:MAG: lipopolysaccharide transport periplasmic protein LptA [Pelistega sp.]|nr:lipopolysaccharide transport periplasmic protein LptA [Pelistega sp.]